MANITASNSKNVYATASPNSYPYVFTIKFEETGTTGSSGNQSNITVTGTLYGKNISYDVSSAFTLKVFWYDNNSNSGGVQVGDTLTLKSTVKGRTYTVTGNITVPHKEDGTLSGYAKLVYDGSEGSSSFVPPNVDLSTANTALTSIPRYLTVNKLENTSKTETSLNFSWATSNTCSKIIVYYKKSSEKDFNNSTKYNNTTGATSGTFSLTGLSPNTTYNIYIIATRKDSGLTTTTTTKSYVTHNYPYISKVSNTELPIGQAVTLTIVNPLNRTFSIQMKQEGWVSGDTLAYSATNLTGTSVTFTPDSNLLYESIPNSTTGQATYSCIYSSSNLTTTGKYVCVSENCKPDITTTNLSYKDLSTSAQTIIGNDQVLVQGHSYLGIAFEAATPKNYATIKSYTVTYGSVRKEYSGIQSSYDNILGSNVAINSSEITSISISATDSRGYVSNVANIPLTILPWSKPTVEVSLSRKNDFNAETIFIAKAKNYSVLEVDGVDKNLSHKKITFEYYEGTTRPSEDDKIINGDLVDGVQFIPTGEELFELDSDKNYTFIVTITDAFDSGQTTAFLNKGIPILMIDGKQLGVGVNCLPTSSGLHVDDSTYLNGETITSDILTLKGRTFRGTSGVAGYVHLCDITTTGQYQNQFLSIDLLQRNRYGTLTLSFGNSATHGVLNIATFKKSGNIAPYYVKSFQEDGVKTIISIYIQKSESFDNIDVINVKKGNYMDKTVIEWKDIMAETLPEGAVAATQEIETSSPLDAYPVGSIYMSLNATSPASLFGGTWTQIKDKFLLGAGAIAVNQEGGNATHTHTLSHTHSVPKHSHGYGSLYAAIYNSGTSGHYYTTKTGVSFTANEQKKDTGAGATSTKACTEGTQIYGNTGEKAAFNTGAASTSTTSSTNHYPPYLTVNIWRRTA